MSNTQPQILHFRVADIVFAVHYYDEGNVRHLLYPYKNFYLPSYEGEVDMLCEVKPGLVSNDPEGEEMGQFDTGDVIHGVFLLPNKGYKFQLRNSEGDIACAVRTNAKFTHIEGTLTTDKRYRAYGLNNMLMICFAYCAAYHNTILLHASVVEREGKAYLFLGKSGTGKSTHTQLWIRHLRGSCLLNDDNPAARVHDDGSVIVYGTPWSGKTPCYKNEQRPVGAFVRLEQWKENLIKRENVINSFASVLSSCSTMMWDKPSYNQICDTCTKIVGKIPVFHLRNLPNEDAARLSYETISKG